MGGHEGAFQLHGGEMALPILSRLMLVAALCGVAGSGAIANSDPEGRFSGGRPAGVRAKGLFEILSLQKQEVNYDSKEKPGTIVIVTRERKLYLVLGPGRAMRYGVGVGRDGYTWSGTHTVTNKREWPDWRPPPEMLKRQPYLPKHMKGGPGNPLGARAMYIGSTIYRIHGTHEPDSVGEADSSGCIRLTNADVIDLYDRVKVGAKVVVVR
jgi:lipoprotein-anchoring transpeptidase ErfK/SrfK